VVPLVDTERGFTSVFTLNLQNTVFISDGTNDGDYDYGWDMVPLMNHQNSHHQRWNHYNNLTPGILIKYFNGVEH
jgi:hypothetical protein